MSLRRSLRGISRLIEAIVRCTTHQRRPRLRAPYRASPAFPRSGSRARPHGARTAGLARGRYSMANDRQRRITPLPVAITCRKIVYEAGCGAICRMGLLGVNQIGEVRSVDAPEAHRRRHQNG